jgi:ubiquinone biosynthesis protein COQ9
MNEKITKIRDEILLETLPGVAFDGWNWEGVQQGAQLSGHGADMAAAVFPGGLKEVIGHFSDYINRQMMVRLAAIDPQDLRIRERIRTGVQARFEAMQPYKEAERLAVTYWMRPLRKWEGVRLVWAAADLIWDWAGDTATDYNRYTKRGLLSAILTSTTLAWLNDTGRDLSTTMAFVDRRIENVMQFEKIKGKLKRA